MTRAACLLAITADCWLRRFPCPRPRQTSGNAGTGATLGWRQRTGCHGALPTSIYQAPGAANAGGVILNANNFMGGLVAGAVAPIPTCRSRRVHRNLRPAPAAVVPITPVQPRPPLTFDNHIYLGTTYGAFTSLQTVNATARQSTPRDDNHTAAAEPAAHQLHTGFWPHLERSHPPINITALSAPVATSNYRPPLPTAPPTNVPIRSVAPQPA
jgi:hypothetical protein